MTTKRSEIRGSARGDLKEARGVFVQMNVVSINYT